jgi:hypothetical protein
MGVGGFDLVAVGTLNQWYIMEETILGIHPTRLLKRRNVEKLMGEF